MKAWSIGGGRQNALDLTLNYIGENIDSDYPLPLLASAHFGRGKTTFPARVAAELRNDKNLFSQLLPARFSLNFPLGWCRNSMQQIDFIGLIGFSGIENIPMYYSK